jgi:hypothetical protein
MLPAASDLPEQELLEMPAAISDFGLPLPVSLQAILVYLPNRMHKPFWLEWTA